MKTCSLSVALMSVGLVVAAPAFAQTTPVQKQKTQEGGASMPTPITQPYNANPSGDPNYKQKTQEGGASMPLPIAQPYNANPNGDPNYKQRTQEGGGPSMPTPIAQPFNANPSGDPNYKQRTQNLSPSADQAFDATGKQK